MQVQSYNNNVIDNAIDIDVIYAYDKTHCDSDKINGQYYIGLCDNTSRSDALLLSMSMSANAFFKYPFMDALQYMYYYGLNFVT